MASKTKGKNIPKNKKKGGKRRISTALFSVLIVLLLTVIIVGACLLVYMVSFVNGDIAINLDSYKNSQDQTSIVYAMDENNEAYEIARLHGEENRIWVDLSDIPENVQNAFVCLEDKRFYNHSGVDWVRTVKAILTLGKSGGGSTLTQQLIKNLTDENSASVSRKFNEILYALNLEKNYDKHEILEAYLNTIPLGSGCYGVQTAAQKYFGKDVEQLNAAEAATIASITKAPTKYNPLLNPANNEERKKTCLWNMNDQGKLSDADYKAALDYKLILTNSDDYVPQQTNHSANSEEKKINSYYVDYVIDSVINDLVQQYGYSANEAWRMVYYGGLKIYSAVDEKVQGIAEDVYENRISFPSESADRTETGENGTKKKIQSAITIMDYEGRVVAMVGGAGEKRINRGLNRATDSKRSPGSSIKPLSVYAPAIDTGKLSYSSKIENYGIIVNGERWPQNYGGSMGTPGSMVTLQYAIAQSLNTTAARTLKLIGIEKSFEYLTERFHLTTLVEEGENTDKNYSSLAVGGMTHGVTTLEMAAAYATFGNGGKYYAPYCYYKVTDYSGESIILQTTPTPEQAISEFTATVMNRIMQTVPTQGTGKGAGVGKYKAFMKTGTTSDTKDKWTCGGTPYYVAAVWLGYDKQEEIKVSGGVNPATRVWAAVMNRVQDGLADKDFNYSSKLIERKYCTITGLLAGEGCPTATGYYEAGKLPRTCSGHASESSSDSSDSSSSDTTAGTTAATSSAEN